MMHRRVMLDCWSCRKHFELTLNLTGSPLFVKECPFCGVQCEFDLRPYRPSTTAVFKGNSDSRETDGGIWRFPSHIPTAAPTKED